MERDEGRPAVLLALLRSHHEPCLVGGAVASFGDLVAIVEQQEACCVVPYRGDTDSL